MNIHTVVRLILICCICIISTLSTGCTSAGKKPPDAADEVSLSGGNFKMVKANAEGTSRGLYLLGIIPIIRPTYSDARNDLYKSLDVKLEGRSIALVNQLQDKTTIYLVAFSFPKLIYRADVVEFTGPPVGAGKSPD